MTEEQVKREKIIKAIDQIPFDKLEAVEQLINEITQSKIVDINNIYQQAKDRYNDTLQKLAE